MIKGRSHLRLLPSATPFKPAVQLQRELGLGDLLRLGANENALGPSPLAVRAMAEALHETHRYPDAGSGALRRRLAAHTGFAEGQIAVDVGISGLLRVALEAFLEPGQRVVFPWPTFSAYNLMVLALGGEPVHVPLGSDLQVDFSALARAARGARMVWLCNPNNPTGVGFGLDPIRRLCESLPPDCLLLVDEAYWEYSDLPTATALVREGYPVAVLRTFSKAYGLAGMRIGYGIMDAALADWFHRCRDPFQVNLAAEAGALAALDDREFLERSAAMVRAGRKYLAAACRELGLESVDSQGNFVLIRLGGDCRPVAAQLLAQGVMVRATDELFDLPGCLRVTVGTPEANRRFMAALHAVLGG